MKHLIIHYVSFGILLILMVTCKHPQQKDTDTHPRYLVEKCSIKVTDVLDCNCVSCLDFFYSDTLFCPEFHYFRNNHTLESVGLIDPTDVRQMLRCKKTFRPIYRILVFETFNSFVAINNYLGVDYYYLFNCVSDEIKSIAYIGTFCVSSGNDYSYSYTTRDGISFFLYSVYPTITDKQMNDSNEDELLTNYRERQFSSLFFIHEPIFSYEILENGTIQSHAIHF